MSDDNAFAETLFRTAKYRPEFPLKGFVDLDDARQWAMRFVQWDNHGHRHSGIRYVTPAQRHTGQDGPVLAARHAVYQDARPGSSDGRSGACCLQVRRTAATTVAAVEGRAGCAERSESATFSPLDHQPVRVVGLDATSTAPLLPVPANRVDALVLNLR